MCRIFVAFALVGLVSANAGPLVGTGSEFSGNGRNEHGAAGGPDRLLDGQTRDFAHERPHSARPAITDSLADGSRLEVVFSLRGVTVDSRSKSNGTHIPRELPTYGFRWDEDGLPRFGLAEPSHQALVAADGDETMGRASTMIRENALTVPEAVELSSIDTTVVRDKDLRGLPRQETVNTELDFRGRGLDRPIRR